ncbi:hypothetical protein NKJ26_01630 [Mesorhizobium sp. M0152]|uniref:hypothetical protein n=1 Tax=Mesorhizobium sp. M0152 TaxID=2956898 RepID=UPI003339CEA9
MGAGASILGSLLGGKKEETTSHVDYARMVRDSEAAGFNPLTAIRNGGSAGFTSTTSPGSGGLSAALSTAGNFLQNFDPFADAKRDQESRYVEAQINNLNAQSGSYNRTASTPSGPVLRNSGTAGLTLAPGKVQATNPMVNRGVIDDTFADADAWEARYSDFGGWAGGVLNIGADLDANIRRMWPGSDTVFADGRKAVRGFFKGPRTDANPWFAPPGSGNQPGGNMFTLPPMINPWGLN